MILQKARKFCVSFAIGTAKLDSAVKIGQWFWHAQYFFDANKMSPKKVPTPTFLMKDSSYYFSPSPASSPLNHSSGSWWIWFAGTVTWKAGPSRWTGPGSLSNTSRAMSWWFDSEAASRWPSTPAAGRSGKKRRLAVVASSPFSGRPLSQWVYILVRSHMLSPIPPPPSENNPFIPFLPNANVRS
jgi:hypothetical protein